MKMAYDLLAVELSSSNVPYFLKKSVFGALRIGKSYSICSILYKPFTL